MSEFNSRMAAQRHIVHLINSKSICDEELFGLSVKAIDRWIISNNINADSRLVCLIKSAASRIACLATKSQEQVSEDYFALMQDIDTIINQIKTEIS